MSDKVFKCKVVSIGEDPSWGGGGWVFSGELNENSIGCAVSFDGETLYGGRTVKELQEIYDLCKSSNDGNKNTLTGNTATTRREKMIKPTLGRVVWYTNNVGEQHTALVCKVWTDTCVNLACFDENGNSYNATSVLLYQGDEGEERPDVCFCEWMPYQKAQAEKAAAV